MCTRALRSQPHPPYHRTGAQSALSMTSMSSTGKARAVTRSGSYVKALVRHARALSRIARQAQGDGGVCRECCGAPLAGRCKQICSWGVCTTCCMGACRWPGHAVCVPAEITWETTSWDCLFSGCVTCRDARPAQPHAGRRIIIWIRVD